MIRTQIQLKESQVAALRDLAAEHSQSMAELIRTSIDLFVKQEGGGHSFARIERAKRAVGKFASDSADGSKQHDFYLANAFSTK